MLRLDLKACERQVPQGGAASIVLCTDARIVCAHSAQVPQAVCCMAVAWLHRVINCPAMPANEERRRTLKRRHHFASLP